MRGGHDDERPGVRQDVPRDDAEPAHPERLGRRDELVAPDREDETADHAGETRPADERQDRDNPEIDLLAREIDRKDRAQRDDQIQRRNAEQQFRAAHDHRVGHPAEVARDPAEQQAEGERDENADQADRERHLTAEQQSRQFVPPERVGAEQIDASDRRRRTGGGCSRTVRATGTRIRGRRSARAAPWWESPRT